MKKTTWIILSLVAVVLLTAMGFCIKQYYHFAVSNFQSMDGESHSYHVYPDMTTDSLMTEMLGDYEMASDLAKAAISKPRTGFQLISPWNFKSVTLISM